MVSVRLSDDEKAALDAARGGLKPGDYLRGLIPTITAEEAVPLLLRVPEVYPEVSHIPPDGAIVSPNEPRLHDPYDTVVDDTEDTMPNGAPLHRHRRNKIIGEHFEKGSRVITYSCAVEGCTEVLT